MQSLRPSPEELPELQEAARLLKEANAALANAKKQAEAAKDALTKWLDQKRKIQVAALKIGDVLVIEQVAIIRVTSAERLDGPAFKMQQPALYAAFTREFAVTRFEPTAT